MKRPGLDPHKKISSVIFTAVFLLLVGQDKSAAEDVNTEMVQDNLIDKINVSGGIYVGLVAAGSKAVWQSGGSSINIKISEDVDAPLCIDVNSADGTYHGEFKVRRKKWLANTDYTLMFDSQHFRKLSLLGDGELTALVTIPETTDDSGLEPRCGRAIKSALIGSWDTKSGTEQFFVYLNSGGTQVSVVAELENDDPEVFKCQSFGDGASVAFNQRCEVKLSTTDVVKQLYVKRKRFFNELPQVKIPLLR